MSDWGHESEDLFRSARRRLSPTAGDRERVRARIRAKVAAAAVGAAVTGAAAKAAGATSSAGAATGAAGAGAAGAGAGIAGKGLSLALLAKIAVPLVIAGAGLAAAPHVIASRAPVAPAAVAQTAVAAPFAPPPLPAPAPVAVEALPTVAIVPAVARATSPAVPRVVTARPAPSVAALETDHGPSPAAAPAPSSANEAEEAALVGAIDAALRSGDSAGALRLAADHQRRFPQGVLSEEREGARVVARCMASRSPSASDAATAFLASHPRSPMRARIAATCGTVDSK